MHDQQSGKDRNDGFSLLSWFLLLGLLALILTPAYLYIRVQRRTALAQATVAQALAEQARALAVERKRVALQSSEPADSTPGPASPPKEDLLDRVQRLESENAILRKQLDADRSSPPFAP